MSGEKIIPLKDAERRRRRKDTAPPTDSDRPVIRIVRGEIPRAVDEAERALIASKQGLYQRGGMIVRPVRSKIITADGGKAFAWRVAVVPPAHLRECLTRAARFEKFDGRTEDWVTVDAPKDVTEMLHARAMMSRLDVIVGIINGPTLRADGSILETPGYDRATGLLLDLEGQAFPAIPSRATKDAAREALKRLKNGLLSTFPFVSPADSSAALSMILTLAVRRSLSAAPCHAVTATTAGSGKSKLVDIASLVVTGRPAAVLSQTAKEDENEKRLAAALINADAVVSIDNCEYPLGGGLLCQAISQSIVKVRVLGLSLNTDVPASAFITGTGNNLSIAGDMTRRVILCSLDPQCERPELREFASDPLDMKGAERAEYLAAALTVMRAYIVAGHPAPLIPLGGFADWSRWVREPLVWLGETDPAETMQKARGTDPAVASLRSLMDQWEIVVGERRVPLRELITEACEEEAAFTSERYRRPDFRDVLLSIAGDGDKVNPRRLGKWLLRYQGRVINGRRIVQVPGAHGVAYWRLELVEAP